MAARHTLLNAVLGAIAAIVLTFVPFSTVLGGALAGFLEGESGRDGVIVGALAGLITLIPMALLGFLVLGIVGVGFGVTEAPIGGFVLFVILLFFVLLFWVVYTVGLSALGGYLGSYLAREYPAKRTNALETLGFESTGTTVERRPDTPPPETEERRQQE